MTVQVTILEAAHRLLDHPESGREGRRVGTREVAVKRTSYLIVYRVGASAVEIIRVWRASRRPFP